MKKIIIGFFILLLVSIESFIVHSIYIHHPQAGKKKLLCGHNMPIPPGFNACYVHSNCSVDSMKMHFSASTKGKAEEVLHFYQNYFRSIGWNPLEIYSGEWEEMAFVADEITMRKSLISAWTSPDNELVGAVALSDESHTTFFPWEDDYRAVFKINAYVHDVLSYLVYLKKSGELDKLMHVLKKYERKDGSYDSAKAVEDNPDNKYVQFYHEILNRR